MKKLLMVGLCLYSFAVYSQPIQSLCLNKYKLPAAATMREDFLNGGNINHAPTSVWFSQDFIQKMLALLTKESTLGGKIPDGIRVYFGTSAGKNTVMLVSTYAFGSDPTVPSKTFHQDYFDHDSTDPLFTSTNGYGETCYDGSCKGGAKLNDTCGNICPDDRDCTPSGDFRYITRLYGEGMIKTFASTSATIGTKCEWFDLTLLRGIDSEMRTNHTDYDGIRIYFGRHSHYDLISPDKEAFVIEPTTASATDTSIHIDSFNCKAASLYYQKVNVHKEELKKLYIKQFQDLYNFDKKYDNKTVKDLVAALFTTGVENGEICPTHCPGTSF